VAGGPGLEVGRPRQPTWRGGFLLGRGVWRARTSSHPGIVTTGPAFLSAPIRGYTRRHDKRTDADAERKRLAICRGSWIGRCGSAAWYLSRQPEGGRIAITSRTPGSAKSFKEVLVKMARRPADADISAPRRPRADEPCSSRAGPIRNVHLTADQM